MILKEMTSEDSSAYTEKLSHVKILSMKKHLTQTQIPQGRHLTRTNALHGKCAYKSNCCKYMYI